MTYEVQPVSLGSRWDEQIAEVVGGAFDISRADVIGRIRSTIGTEAARPSVTLAAIEGEELIGFNAFIAHDLISGRDRVSAFQSCWTATSPRHRGKRVFQSIITEAHRRLAADGASLVIGWPNANSEPLFVHKLGYRREASVKRQVPGPFAERFVSRAAPHPTGLGQNDEQLIELKRKVHGNALWVERGGRDDQLLWGLIRHRTTRLGTIPYFDVGGLRWSREGGARELVRALRKRLPFCAYWQFVSEARNSINPAVGRFVQASTNPLIWYPLKPEAQDSRFDFFGGIRDVY